VGATSGQLGKSFHGLLLAKKNANSVQVNNNMGTDKAPSLFLKRMRFDGWCRSNNYQRASQN
jgi:hypothetical protein